MTNIPDRIKLAEAMGWKFHHQGPPPQDFGCPTAFYWIDPDGKQRLTHRSDYKDGKYLFPQGGKDLFLDPFTDANDDYAVLEWAIKNLDPDAYFAALTEVVGSYAYLHEYRIGYFARAALKVIAATKQGESDE